MSRAKMSISVLEIGIPIALTFVAVMWLIWIIGGINRKDDLCDEACLPLQSIRIDGTCWCRQKAETLKRNLSGEEK